MKISPDPMIAAALALCALAGCTVTTAMAQGVSAAVERVETRTSRTDRGAARNLAAQQQAPLTDTEIAIAQLVHTGTLPCELGAHVVLTPDPATAGFFSLRFGKSVYRLSPQHTSTGVVRLEDPVAGIVWLQIATKSMLMDQKLGRRLADECQSPAQALVAQANRRNPPVSMLDAPAAPSKPRTVAD